MLDKITNNIHERFKTYAKSPAFQQGVKDFKKGNMKKIVIKPVWVKQLISNKEWNTYYLKNSSYCYLSKHESGGVWVGFVIGLPEGETKIPDKCQPCTQEELRQIDDYRVANNIKPLPLNLHKVI